MVSGSILEVHRHQNHPKKIKTVAHMEDSGTHEDSDSLEQDISDSMNQDINVGKAAVLATYLCFELRM